MIDVLQLEEDIRRIVTENARLSIDDDGLADDTNLFMAGMTSFATVSIMISIEDHFGLTFPDHLIRQSTFETVSTLAQTVKSLLE